MRLYMSWYVTTLTDAAIFRSRPNGVTHTGIVLLRPGMWLQLHCVKHSAESFEASQLSAALALFLLCDRICITRTCPRF